MKPLLIYCYDAYCGWCYAFSPVIKKLWPLFKDDLDFEVLSAGMILPEKPLPISVIAPYLKKTCKEIESLTGAHFGKDYLWHIDNPERSDWYPYSEKPAIALSIFKEYFPEGQVQFATDIQQALLAEGRDLCDDEAYRHLLMKHQISPEEFYRKLKSNAYKEKAHQEFSIVKQLKITGYPSLLLQISDTKYYLIASGYSGYESLSEKVQAAMNQLTTSEIKIVPL